MSLSAHLSLPIDAVLVGRPKPFGPPGRTSAIDKKPVLARCAVTERKLAGDQQADLRFHGGPEKAVHHYPRDHYAAWLADLPLLGPLLKQPGAFGENVSTTGMTEAEVCIGDVYRLGSALVQVSQGRQPCWKLNVRFDVPDMALRVQNTGRTGWYYRVLEPGDVAAGDRIELQDRPHGDWPLSRLLDVLYHNKLDAASLQEMARLEPLAESWRKVARRRLDTMEVEDWSRRVATPG
ncbi:MOSC domain-containing protein [Dongia soli]|uniref:MOSC domain-containing protein n=1 Tax=Dongia soli TaxID=600628 RepID=A0ABU5EBE3_9PROT|nr:MOSC domain-containing protein [Dongia soli]MDY0883161.1 MOSC domain-containing protein [Dongia soli]